MSIQKTAWSTYPQRRSSWLSGKVWSPQERRLIADYEALIDLILAGMNHDKHRLAVDLASIPEQIRGYGHVKQSHLDKALKRQAELLAEFQAPAGRQTAAE